MTQSLVGKCSCALWIMTSMLVGQKACADNLDVNKVTSAYLYQMFNFTDWPDGSLDSNNFMTLCLIGDEVENAYIDTINGKSTGNRTIQVVRLTASSSLDHCNALYINNHDAEQRNAILIKTKAQPILTISTYPGFAEAGGIVEFVYNSARLRLKINISAMNQKGLRISSKLLSFAEVIAP